MVTEHAEAADQTAGRLQKCTDTACGSKRKVRCKSDRSMIEHILKFHSPTTCACPVAGCRKKNGRVYDIQAHLKDKHKNCDPAHRKILKNQGRRARKFAERQIDWFFPMQPQMKRESEGEATEVVEVATQSSKRTSAPQRRNDVPRPETRESTLPDLQSPQSTPTPQRQSTKIVFNDNSDDDLVVEKHVVRAAPDPHVVFRDYHKKYGPVRARPVEWRLSPSML
ncbi:hypothetical protein L596_015864 [Steinernema carpocapsae]|uniref:C2H2-type domain-containing protein n=1 Tax=Steinernema carpocapsae TaxID=34508 RepID=A0A4U5NH80_STECR|nr:hypothetical protein L596_015864 [Steinernema carpocapsae]